MDYHYKADFVKPVADFPKSKRDGILSASIARKMADPVQR